MEKQINRKNPNWPEADQLVIFTERDRFQISPDNLTWNITSHSMENLAFHSLLRWKMIILPILPPHLYIFSLKG